MVEKVGKKDGTKRRDGKESGRIETGGRKGRDREE